MNPLIPDNLPGPSAAADEGPGAPVPRYFELIAGILPVEATGVILA